MELHTGALGLVLVQTPESSGSIGVIVCGVAGKLKTAR